MPKPTPICPLCKKQVPTEKDRVVVQWHSQGIHYPRQWVCRNLATYHTGCMMQFLKLNEVSA